MRSSSGGAPLAFENRCRRRDGEYRRLPWSVVPDAGRGPAVGRAIPAAVEAADIQNREMVQSTLNWADFAWMREQWKGKLYIKGVSLAFGGFVAALLAMKVSRIILVRPAVVAGERLGFLPGSLQEKVDPYLRPLYDALYDLLDQEKVDKLLERNVIEVAPLAFMRGRTLSDAFIIMDEAQNTTTEQMKMFVTRLGNNSKAVITGDLTQTDLPNPKKSGLLEAIHVLDGVDGIRFCHFDDVDVVRHHLVQRIVRAYDNYGRAQKQLPLSLDAVEGAPLSGTGVERVATAKPQ